MALTRSNRIKLFDIGIVVVGVSLPLPWAEVAGRPRSGPAFANLLLSLPEVELLGDHLTFVAVLWYSIPLLALAAWLTQFRTWPRELSRWSVVFAALLALVVAVLVVWLAVRGVGFPTLGPAVAVIGAGVVLGATLLGSHPASTTDNLTP